MGRKKSKILTPEQIAWRDSILKTKIKTVIKSETLPPVILSKEDQLRRCFYYLNNCVFWVNEYIEGRVDESRLLEIARALKVHSQMMEDLLSNKKVL